MIRSLAIISAQPKGNPNMNFFGFNRSSSSQTNTLQTIDAQTLKQWLDQQTVILVDVREAEEYATGHIPGATLMPLSTFDPRQIPQSQNQKIVLYCRSGQRSTMASQKLLKAGFSEVAHLGGGIGAWRKAGYPVQA
jgi:rhodanese-related sulfurtransferase